MEMSERPTAVMEMDENAKGHRPRSRVERLGHQLRTLWRRPVHLWRASLGFRVVVATMLLGILVLTAVGTYLYGSIAQGLVDVHLLVVQRLGATGLMGEAQPVRKPVDHDDALGPQQVRALHGQLSHGTRAPDRHRGGGGAAGGQAELP